MLSMLLMEGKSIRLTVCTENPISSGVDKKKKELIPILKIINYLLFINHPSHNLVMTLPTPLPHQINFISVIFISST